MNESNKTLLEDYSNLPAQLEEVIAGLDESELSLRKKNNEWSIREYICHLVEGEQLWQINLRMILGMNGAKFPMTWYPKIMQLEWSAIWAYDRRSLQVMLDQYHADTQYLVDLLQNLPDAVWDYYGRITWPGNDEESRYSVRDIVKMHISHLDVHSEDIRAIRALYGC